MRTHQQEFEILISMVALFITDRHMRQTTMADLMEHISVSDVVAHQDYYKFNTATATKQFVFGKMIADGFLAGQASYSTYYIVPGMYLKKRIEELEKQLAEKSK